MVKGLKNQIALIIFVFTMCLPVCQAEIYELDVMIDKTVFPGDKNLGTYIQRKENLKNQVIDSERTEAIENEMINASVASALGHQKQYNTTYTIEVINGKIERYSVKGIHPVADLLKKPNGQVNIRYDYYIHVVNDRESCYQKRTILSQNKIREMKHKYDGFNRAKTSECFYVEALELLANKLETSKQQSPLTSEPLTYAINTDEKYTFGDFLAISNHQNFYRNYYKEPDGTISYTLEYTVSPDVPLPLAKSLKVISDSHVTIYSVNSIKTGVENDFYIPKNIPYND